MKFIIDSSVALKWVFDEPDTVAALAVRQAGHELWAPDLLIAEAGHVIAKAFRRRQLTEQEVFDAMEDILATPITLAPAFSIAARATEIAIAAHCTYYDALYVALSEEEDCDLITADEHLQRAYPSGRIVLLSSL